MLSKWLMYVVITKHLVESKMIYHRDYPKEVFLQCLYFKSLTIMEKLLCCH